LTVGASLNPTHNGTAQFTVFPDLVSVVPDATTNTIVYVFDQAVATAPVAGRFIFTRSGGTECSGAAAPIISGNQVIVPFAPGPCPVSDAVRAGTEPMAVTAAADPGAPGTSPPDQVIVPNTNGTTARPDLISSSIAPGNAALDFVIDKNVGVLTATNFIAILSTGQEVFSTSAVVVAVSTTQTTIRATFPFFSQWSEYIVRAGIDDDAVQESSAPNLTNVDDSTSAGDNAGAFARGFTTGADVFAAVVSLGTGLVTATVDQRIFNGDPTDIRLVDGTGVVTASGTPGSLTFPSQAPGPQMITIQFSPGQATTAKNIWFQDSAMQTNQMGPGPNQDSEDQVLSVTTSASLLRAARSARSHKGLSKGQLARREARIEAEQRAASARFLHRFHHH
jgi:hypothetical protein